jgi:hypothetical protein
MMERAMVAIITAVMFLVLQVSPAPSRSAALRSCFSQPSCVYAH